MELGCLNGPAERAEPPCGRLGTNDVADRRELAQCEAADAVHDEVRSVDVIAERARDLGCGVGRHGEKEKFVLGDLGVVGRDVDEAAVFQL